MNYRVLKELLLVFSFCVSFVFVTSAQKFAYVDSQYILEKVPEYKDAQAELDKLSQTWQKEIDNLYKEIEDLYNSYQAEQVLLSPEMKKSREAEIAEKEMAVQEFQMQKFGIEGELFRKREELIKPVQDKVFEGIKAVVDQYGYEMIFDKATNSNILFADDKLDKSEMVLRKMGIR